MPVLISNKQGPVSWQISNGRLGYAHYFTHSSEDGFVTPICTTPTGEGGVEYLIPQPSQVNILLAGVDESAPNKNSLISPLPQTSDKVVVMDSFFKRLTSRHDGIAKVLCQNFEYDIALARTLEKLQGANIKRLVMVLADQSISRQGIMTTPQLYFGSTRVSF